MRDRPFTAAGEQPRLYSEVRAERNALSPDTRRLDAMRDEIARLEGEAADAVDPAGRKRLQCEAEAVRISLDEEFARRRLR
jgi:hypothetical protein